jgi:hypothetical protein
MSQGLSNESKFVKIGRMEPEIWVDKEIASKWKIYISKLKPVKGIERLNKNEPHHSSAKFSYVFSWNSEFNACPDNNNLTTHLFHFRSLIVEM